MPSNVRAILWDNDGVLVDTEGLYFAATHEALDRHGIALTPAAFAELSLRRGVSALDLALDAGLDRDGVEELRLWRNARYSELLDAGVRIMEGVEEALSALRDRFRMAIVTSSRRDHFDIIHRRTGLLPNFELVLTGEDYAPHKPHPAPYLEAARRLGLAPAECLVVEDSQRGLESATCAGMRCLVVPNELSRLGDLSAAHRLLDSVREVPSIAFELA